MKTKTLSTSLITRKSRRYANEMHADGFYFANGLDSETTCFWQFHLPIFV